MSKRTLFTILVVPLFFACLALIALVRLDGLIAAYDRTSEQSTLTRSAAISAIDAGELRPSPEQVSAVLKAGAKATESERKLVVSLWSLVKTGLWILVFGGIAHAFICISSYRSAKRAGRRQ